MCTVRLASSCEMDRNRQLACSSTPLERAKGQPESFLLCIFNAFLEKFERKPWELGPGIEGSSCRRNEPREKMTNV